MRVFAIMATLLVAAFTACGGVSSSTATARDATAVMRNAAVRLVFADVNATALPRAYDRRVLERRMRRYVASAWLKRRVATRVAAIGKVGGRHYIQPWFDALTVGQWEREQRHARRAQVVFLAYETVTVAREPAVDRPIERFTVRMYREHGRWRLIKYDKNWLTPEGPMDQSGAETIGSLPERVVFRNPRPAPETPQDATTR
jgi:hypothetical protein